MIRVYRRDDTKLCALCIGEGTIVRREPEGYHRVIVCPQCRGYGRQVKVQLKGETPCSSSTQ